MTSDTFRLRHIARLLAGAALLAQLPVELSAQEAEAEPVETVALEEGFQDPPANARPRVWWHWMNGNVTRDGILKDLEWMERVGIGGVQNFDAALQTPQIVDKRLVYMEPDWQDAFAYAVGLADAKGLEFAVAASPGWSETGGPWVPPEDGMKKLVWSETVVSGGGAGPIMLVAPPGETGGFQDTARVANAAASETGALDPQHYGDAAVVAFPLGDADPQNIESTVTDRDGSTLDAALIADDSYQTAVSVPIGTREAPGQLLVDFGSEREISSLSLAFAGAGGQFGGGVPGVVLEAEGTQGEWEKVADVPMAGPQSTIAFAPVAARRMRLVLTPQPTFSLAFLGSVPGAFTELFPSVTPTSVNVAELRFSNESRIDRFEAKAGFVIADDYYSLSDTALPEASGVDPSTVIDLTDRMQADGTLDWVPPAGTWKILRFGYSLTGTTNHPATVEATGLEVDKYDAAAVRRYLEHYIGMIGEAAGPGMLGERGVRAILTDSTEIGPSNWTPGMIDKFRALRGYDPVPWLPALTGTVIGSRAESDKFLFDFRETLGELMATEHYWTVADVAHENGLIVYGEALEAGRPVLGNELTMRAKADVPMAALWTYDMAQGPRNGLLGDMKGAASVAHIDGQNRVAAESMTAAFSPWAFAPKDLKPVIDLEFAYGVNLPVVHTSVHQPSDEHVPGLSLGPFGQYFNRHETWAEMARPWVDYIARSSFMLQQGRYFADVAYFYGEDSPLTVLYNDGPVEDAPENYAFDFVSPQMLLDTLSVDAGELVSPAGARFAVLYLGGTSGRMTLPVLERIAALAEAGATIVGNAPVSSPSLPDDAARFDALVAQLWSGADVTPVGQGRVIASDDVEAALSAIGIGPDFEHSDAAEIMFLHRRLDDGDAYFLSNRESHSVMTEARFRVTGKAPELWNAETGEAFPASYRVEGDHTIVPLHLAAHDAVFVVFREDSAETSRTVEAGRWSGAGAVGGPWTVSFQEGRGAPASAEFAELADLSQSADPGLRHFSGTMAYSTSFTLPESSSSGAPLILDLGDVGDIAEVYVNGELAGTAWNAPYQLRIGDFVTAGTNTLEIRVANLWVNRLIGDAQEGADPITFTTMPTYNPDAPLRPSGLIGPVTLLTHEP